MTNRAVPNPPTLKLQNREPLVKARFSTFDLLIKIANIFSALNAADLN